ncbi:MAG: relaxase/mobilization nuclease domain-containing protein [Cyanobacteria bacterium P01_F01_bin.86]
MRINVTKGSNPKGLCAYVLDPAKQKDGEKPVVATNMAGQDSDTLTREFEAIVDRPRRWAVKQTMAHYSVSLPPGEDLNRSAMGDISRELLRQMGHQNCPYFAVQHHDQEDKNGVHHWHIVTSTLDYNNEWVDDSFSKLRLQQVARELESQFGLTPCPLRPAAEQQNLTTGEHRRKERTGEVLPKEKLWSAINGATQDRPTLPLLVTRLKAQGIDVHLWRKGDRYSGISFGLEGATFAGRRLGPAYSFGGLQKHKGVHYDATTQNTALVQTLNQSSDECAQVLEDYAALQRNLRELYDEYANRVGQGQEQLDVCVAAIAIRAGHTEQETRNILRQGATAKQLRQEKGQPAEVKYCQQLTQAGLKKLHPEHLNVIAPAHRQHALPQIEL